MKENITDDGEGKDFDLQVTPSVPLNSSFFDKGKGPFWNTFLSLLYAENLIGIVSDTDSKIIVMSELAGANPSRIIGEALRDKSRSGAERWQAVMQTIKASLD